MLPQKTKKNISYITDKQRRAIWLRAFHIWQQTPHQVSPLSETTSKCASCGTLFVGNYCPRCGQSAGVGRFSFKKALLLFLDVWGIGNRSMFRSIRDLMIRPGYMIRDYLSGMQSAYFPPFKMFFLLAAFSLVVERGINLSIDEGQIPDPPEEIVVQKEDMVNKERKEFSINGKTIKTPVANVCIKIVKTMDSLRKQNPAVFSFLSLVLFSFPLYFFFRSTPNIPALRYSEFIVALVYTSNMYSVYSIIGNLLDSIIFKTIAVLMIFIALKQLSGFTKRRVFGYTVLSSLITITMLIALIGITFCIIYWTS